MKRSVFLTLLVLMLAAATMTSCRIGAVTIGEVKTGPTLTEEIKVAVPEEGGTSQVEIAMAGGELHLSAGDVADLVVGTVRYNLEDIRPGVLIQGRRVRIEQGDIEGKRIPLGDWSDVENRWVLTLGTAPLDLEVTVGAAQAELLNLADLNARTIDLNGGAGDFTLDFSGDLRQDVRVAVDAGAAQVTIVVPEGTPADLSFEGALTDVDYHGAWEKDGRSYSVPGEGPRLTFTIRMGLGSLDLRTR